MPEPTPSYVNSIHELIAGFFGNKFYNILYNIAKHNQSKSRDTITNIYLIILSKLESSIDTNVVYSSEIRELHEFVRGKAKKLEGTFATFQHNLLGGFVPAVYLDSMTDVDKDNIFNTIILTCYKSTIRMMRQREALRTVIDDRQNGAIHIRQLQDAIINLLRSHRDDLYTKFARLENKDRDAVPTLSAEIVKLREDLTKRNAIIGAMKEANGKLSTDLENARQTIDELRRTLSAKSDTEPAQIQNLTDELARRVEQMESQRAELAKCQAESANLRTELTKCRAESANLRAESTNLRAELTKCQAEKEQLEEQLSRAAVPLEPAELFPSSGQGKPAQADAGLQSIADDESGTVESESSDDDSYDEWARKLREKQNAAFGL